MSKKTNDKTNEKKTCDCLARIRAMDPPVTSRLVMESLMCPECFTEFCHGK